MTVERNDALNEYPEVKMPRKTTQKSSILAMLIDAFDFNEAGHMLRDKGLGHPAQVMLCFTAEILLKAAIQMDKGEYPTDAHNLSALFELLPAPQQESIREAYRDGFHLPPEAKTESDTRFNALLDAVKSDFVRLRYAFEKVGPDTEWIDHEGAEALVASIIDGLRDYLPIADVELAPRPRRVLDSEID